MINSLNLEKVIDNLMESSPPCNLKEIDRLLTLILFDPEDSLLIKNSLEKYIKKQTGIFSHEYIASKFNKHPNSNKYVDYINKKLFNVDLKSYKAIDFEDHFPEIDYPDFYNDLVLEIEKYGRDHFPSFFAFTIVPINKNETVIIIIGQKFKNVNFFTGQWKSYYKIDSSHNIEGQINLDIYYCENGNLRLQYDENVKEKISTINASYIIKTIKDLEDSITLKIMENFNNLNQKSFKNLRRLLPVTKSKINWNSVVGFYKNN